MHVSNAVLRRGSTAVHTNLSGTIQRTGAIQKTGGGITLTRWEGSLGGASYITRGRYTLALPDGREGDIEVDREGNPCHFVGMGKPPHR